MALRLALIIKIDREAESLQAGARSQVFFGARLGTAGKRFALVAFVAFSIASPAAAIRTRSRSAPCSWFPQPCSFIREIEFFVEVVFSARL
jgi:hypothetical protein